MNALKTEQKAAVVSLLCEGSSIRSAERITGIHRDTIMRLGVRVGQTCAAIQDRKMRNIQSTDIQIDEIWGFIGKKKKHAKPFEVEAGDIWTFIALCRETKVIPAFLVGQRTL